MALGFCYAGSNDFENSVKFYSQALEKNRGEDENTVAASKYSKSLYRDGKKTDSINILIDALSTVSKDSNKVQLYESLADIYNEENDHENRAFVLDKAIELKPNDKSLIFKVGYSYSLSGHDELSLLHYKNAQRIDPKDEAVNNNLGVQYDRLDMPIKSVSSYREAHELGLTLASANLANRLLNAGFAKEAGEILNSAAATDVHPNVNLVLSDIPERIEKEDKTEKEKIRIGLELRRFNLGYAEAKFSKDNKLSYVEGEWTSETGSVFRFSVAETILAGTWKEKKINYELNWKLEGMIFNNSSIIKIYKEEYNFSKSESHFKEQASGFLFCSSDGDTIQFIKSSAIDKSRDTFVLTRNSFVE